jgi:GxxExxY protein
MKSASTASAFPVHRRWGMTTPDTPSTRQPFRDEQTGTIIGAGIVVHTKMGRGFLEPVYSECLVIEFKRQGIPFEREVALSVSYDGILLPSHFRVDFICYESVVVEVKALAGLTPREMSQMMNYLRASDLHRGLLLNFGAATLETRRIVWGLEDDPLMRCRSVIQPSTGC